MGSPKLNKILAIVCFVATISAAGIFLYSTLIYEKPLPNEKDEKEALFYFAKKEVEVETYKMKNLKINLVHSRNSSSRRLRFISVEPHLLPFKKEHKPVYEENIALITDTIIAITSAMSPNELNTISGKILLKSRIKKKINSKFSKPIIKEIYFPNYIVK
jgi:flagellar FliL protein